jgi:uncharacterized protein
MSFVPAPLLSSGHAQTVAGSLLRKGAPIAWVRVRHETPDGDFFDVDGLEGRPGLPTLLVLHGLEGSANSGYVRVLARLAAGRGFAVQALNFRGCSGQPNRLARAYHSGHTDDVGQLLAALAGRTVVAAGFSLGGNVLLQLLGKGGVASGIAAAGAVSVPFDLAAGAALLDASTATAAFYRRAFLPSLKAKALEKAKRFPGAFDVEQVRRLTRIRAFDEVFTAPLSGFSSAHDYYARCSSMHSLARVQVPTLVLSAQDDPLAPAAQLPPRAADNPALTVETPAHGGHVGFVEGSLLRPRFWAEQRALDFLAQAVEPRPRAR